MRWPSGYISYKKKNLIIIIRSIKYLCIIKFLETTSENYGRHGGMRERKCRDLLPECKMNFIQFQPHTGYGPQPSIFYGPLHTSTRLEFWELLSPPWCSSAATLLVPTNWMRYEDVSTIYHLLFRRAASWVTTIYRKLFTSWRRCIFCSQ